MATILTFQDVWIPPPPPVPPSPLEPSAVQRVGSTSTPVDSTSTEDFPELPSQTQLNLQGGLSPADATSLVSFPFTIP